MHYDLPTLDMFSMRGMTNFWNRWGGGVHPKWPVHAMIADTLAYVWGNSWESSCSKGHSGPTPLGKTFWPVAELAELTTCKKPLTVYSARNVSTAKPQMTAGDFRLYEDRAGKPGWIASQPGSCMKFPLTFGQDPRFAVTYLKSYLNISNVQVKLRKATYTLKGHWPTGDSRQVSLYSTKWFKVHKSELGSRTAKFAKLKTLADFTFMSGVEPNSELTVELCLSPVSDQSEQKVKVVQVVSC